MEGIRIDKWLWAARFFKTRSLAQTAVERGHVLVGGERVKVSRAVHVGDLIRVRVGDIERTVDVLGVSGSRGPAPVAQALYEETRESVARRVDYLARKALNDEPAWTIEGGRPTKRDRRALHRLQADQPSHDDQ